MLAENLLQEFVSLQSELSKGYYFKEYLDIMVHQFANQALIYLERPHDIDLDWQAFTKIHPSARDSLIIAKTKLNFFHYAESVKSQREKYGYGYKLKYSGHYKAEKEAFLGQTFLNPNSDLPKRLVFEVKTRGGEVPRLDSFVNSESVDCVPFVIIFCALWASIIFHEKTRTPRKSDVYDVFALTCAIPYCRIITTDTNMKNFIGRLRLDEKYGISVYAPTNRDLDAFAKVLTGYL